MTYNLKKLQAFRDFVKKEEKALHPVTNCNNLILLSTFAKGPGNTARIEKSWIPNDIFVSQKLFAFFAIHMMSQPILLHKKLGKGQGKVSWRIRQELYGGSGTSASGVS